MSDLSYFKIDKEREFDLLQRGLRTQLELAMKSGDALVKEAPKGRTSFFRRFPTAFHYCSMTRWRRR